MTRRAELPDTAESARLARVYGGYASTRRRAWSSENPANACIRRELTAALLDAAWPALEAGRPVLDVGCGTGWWLRALADAGVAPARLHGVDLLDERLAAARDRVPGARLERADARQLPYDGGTFGLVTLVVTLGSMPGVAAIEHALREARRVARARARVLVYEARYGNPLNRHTLAVRSSTLGAVLGTPLETARLTVAPPVVRPLRGLAPRAYAPLRSLRPLRTHVLRVYEVA